MLVDEIVLRNEPTQRLKSEVTTFGTKEKSDQSFFVFGKFFQICTAHKQYSVELCNIGLRVWNYAQFE